MGRIRIVRQHSTVISLNPIQSLGMMTCNRRAEQ
jgi:hypothetical protein